MDPSDADDGVAAPDVHCGSPTATIYDSSINARSYRRDEENGIGDAGSSAWNRYQNVSPTIGSDTADNSAAHDPNSMGLEATVSNLGTERGIEEAWEEQRLMGLERELGRRVVWQGRAVRAVARAVRR